MNKPKTLSRARVIAKNAKLKNIKEEEIRRQRNKVFLGRIVKIRKDVKLETNLERKMKLLSKLDQMVQKSVTKGVMHKKKASRIVSRTYWFIKKSSVQEKVHE